jgi:hypothetical protein
VARLRAAGTEGAAAAARGGALSAEEEETLACEMGLSRQDLRLQVHAPRAPARHARPAPPPRALPRAHRGGPPEAQGAARAQLVMMRGLSALTPVLSGHAASLTPY